MIPLRAWASVSEPSIWCDLCGWGLDVGELSTCSIICLGVIPSKRCGVGDMVGWLWTATGQPAPVIVLMIVLMLTTRCGGIVHMFHCLHLV